MSYRSLLNFPINAGEILQKKKAIKRELSATQNLIQKKIAILGGSTTSEIKNILELFLLNVGIQPVFYESEFNKYYEDVLFENSELKSFKPDVIYIHTTHLNITEWPAISDNSEEVSRKKINEIEKFKKLWKKISDNYKCAIIQNNFDWPITRSSGNLECSQYFGKINFINSLNGELAGYAQSTASFYINDINYLSSSFGLERWQDQGFWYAYKYALAYEAIPTLAANIARIIGAIYGLSKKCLVLDLDNTLWGGVIGDDGLSGIQIGHETAVSEAHYGFQKYLAELKSRGVTLAICSKNDLEVANEGLGHPSHLLKISDFAIIKANWDPKPNNIVEIAKALNIDISAIVFVDDNPAEREIVRAQLPQVAVPEMGANIENYARILDRSGYFEPITISQDDLKRNQFYAGNEARKATESKFETYGDFLESLEMTSMIAPISDLYIDRITQLINKTNQFNLTTRRYSLAEVKSIAESGDHVTLVSNLTDKFGENGIVSVVIGEVKQKELHLDAWLMSCRILKRDMELALFDTLVMKAQKKGLKRILGYYKKSSKNAMVMSHYQQLGFKLLKEENECSIWVFEVPNDYVPANRHIRVFYEQA